MRKTADLKASAKNVVVVRNYEQAMISQFRQYGDCGVQLIQFVHACGGMKYDDEFLN